MVLIHGADANRIMSKRREKAKKKVHQRKVSNELKAEELEYTRLERAKRGNIYTSYIPAKRKI